MSELTKDFHIQVVTTKDRVTRILISERVLNELPIIEPMLERLVATDYVEWPESFVIIHHAEPRPPKPNHPIVVLPAWVFERMESEWSKPLSMLDRFLAYRAIDRAAHDFGWVFAHHFKTADDLQPTTAAGFGRLYVLINMNGEKVSYRRIARLIGAAVLLLPFIFYRVARAYAMAKLMPTDHDALFRIATIQAILLRRNALRLTQQKLIAAGASPEDVRKYDLPPDLQIIDKNGQESE